MPTSLDIVFRETHLLKPHEAVKAKKAAHFARFAARIRKLRMKPILVDSATNVILDGHHRWWMAKERGLQRVPCCLVDYLRDTSIQVLPRRKDIPVSKEEVIRMGLSDSTFPHKTTKHLFTIPAMEQWVTVQLE